jgi:hypothetical protein
MSEINDVLKQLAEDNEKRFLEAKKKADQKEQAKRDREQEMRDLDMQLHDAAVQRDIEAKKPKSNDDKLDQVLALLNEVLRERKEEQKSHGPIDGL